MAKKVALSLKCIHCDASLMDEKVRFDGYASIKLNIETAHDRGVLWLSSVYGDYDKKLSIAIDEGEVVGMFCPNCNKELSSIELCRFCEAPMVEFVIRAGGVVLICSRFGCTNHHIEFRDVSTEMSKFYYEYGF
jgi:hypothetical protein